MAAPKIGPGHAIAYPGTGPDHDGNRLHTMIIVGEAKGDFYLVPICSHHNGCDPTCIITDKDGWTPPIIRKSYAAYYMAKKVPVRGTVMKVEAAEVRYLGLVPEQIYTRVVAGLTESDEIEPWFVKGLAV